jgi:long-chain fatty acid transport protein
MKAVLRTMLATTTALVALGAMTAGAQAGGFINSSQSTVFNGMAYAGAAAGGSSSAATMFYNPATMTSFTGLVIDSNYTFGLPTSKATGSFSGVLSPGLNAALPGSAKYDKDYFVPATYIVYQISDKLWGGISINSTYGNQTKADTLWRGSLAAASTKLRIITATPSIAYKINEQWSIGAGLQVQYASARQVVNLAPLGVGGAGIEKADGWAVGFTLGATYVPVQGTQIGIGLRSLTEQNVEGTTRYGAAQSTNSKGTLNLPNRVNLSLRQTINPKLDVLASIEWQNWGRIGHAKLNNPANPALAVLPFGYKDGWFFSLGAEYKATDKLMLRAGVGYEISPVTDEVRRLSLPDSDRFWASFGGSYQVTERMTLNASYSFLHFQKANITQVIVPGALTFNGVSKQNAHLLSVGLTSQWGGPPKREEPLVKKF